MVVNPINKGTGINLIYFSPTNTTKKIISTIATSIIQKLDPKLFSKEFMEKNIINLTKLEVREQLESDESSTELNGILNIIGAPCYEGRIPKIVRNSLKKIKTNNTPSVAIILYGNRTIGISLKQLCSIIDQNGFKIIATGTFIGEHSYSSKLIKMAEGRPNEEDLNVARIFGHKIAEVLNYIYKKQAEDKENVFHFPHFKPEEIPGKIKFFFKLLPEGFLGSFVSPQKTPNSSCNKCNRCVEVCPTNTIDKESLEIDLKKCIRCMACVKACKNNARKIKYRIFPVFKKFMKPAIKNYRKPKYRLIKQL
ncbi:MAG: 4Fe-4S binding protein [Promethearchaeota archaeon]